MAGHPLPPRVFVVTVGERAVASFMAINRNDARELCREPWFRDDLRNHKDESGLPLWDGEAPLQSRPGLSNEVSDYDAAVAKAKQASKCEEGVLSGLKAE